MTQVELTVEQVEQLYRLCRWEDEAGWHQGQELAQSLLGHHWDDFDLEAIAKTPAPQRSGAEDLALAYDFAAHMNAEARDEVQCLHRALSLGPHPLLTRQLLTQWDSGRSYSNPAYDLAWQLVNVGLYRARQAADPKLFHDLLAGVSVMTGRGFEVDEARSPLPVKGGYEILLQHQVRGLVGFAPDDCERALTLRQAVQGLSIDASFDVYKWEREFPVDCTPLSSFENLEVLRVDNGSPVINCQALEQCPRLTTREFTGCHLPWSHEIRWNLDQLKSAARGEFPSPPGWMGDAYVSLETGELLAITRYGARFDSKAKPPPPLRLGFSVDSDEARFIRLLFSEDETERQHALSWGMEQPDVSRKVFWIEEDDMEAWGRFPLIHLPNTSLSIMSMHQELLELVFARESDRFDKLQSLQLSEASSLKNLDWLRFTPALRQLKLHRCQELMDLTGIEKLSELRFLDLSGAEKLGHLEGLQHCASLTSFSMSLNEKVTDFSPLAGLRCLRRLDLSFNQLRDLNGLPDGLRLEAVSLQHCRSLRRLSGLERLRGPEEGGPLKVNLSDCSALHDLTGLGAHLTNVHINLANCRALEDVSGLAQAQELEKLLIVLTGCESLRDLSALGGLPKLRKLHLNLANLRQAPALKKSLNLGPEVKLVIEKRYCRGLYSFD